MKDKKSKLDPFAETLVQMEAEKKTGREMLAWLKEEGCVCSPSTLSEFLSGLRDKRLENLLFNTIASGARMNKELDLAYGRNPEPAIEQLIRVTKSLVISLQVKGAADPKLLNLANSMQQTVLMFLSGQTKAAHKEREVTLAENKAAEAKKSDQQKALEYCLDESKGTPAEELFKQAFVVLKKAKSSRTATT